MSQDENTRIIGDKTLAEIMKESKQSNDRLKENGQGGMMIRCKECKWWKSEVPPSEMGACVRRSPIIVGYPQGSWPLTWKDNYCGEAEPKDSSNE